MMIQSNYCFGVDTKKRGVKMKSKSFYKLSLVLLSVIILFSYNLLPSSALAGQGYTVHKQNVPDPRDALCTLFWLNVAQDCLVSDFRDHGIYFTYGYGGEEIESGNFEVYGNELYLSNGENYIYSRLDQIPWYLQDQILSIYSDFVNFGADSLDMSYTIDSRVLTEDTYIFYHDYSDGDSNYATFLVPLWSNWGTSDNPDNIAVRLNGYELYFDQPPIIVDNRTLVPLRAIFEAMGASVDWIQSEQTVISQRDDVVISLQIGSDFMYRNGEQIILDVPAMVVNDRTLVPVRAISEAFGAEVDWNNSTKTVEIYL